MRELAQSIYDTTPGIGKGKLLVSRTCKSATDAFI